MTNEEKVHAIREYCDSHKTCWDDKWECPLFYRTSSAAECIDADNYDILFPNEEVNPVDHPKHYNREGAMECIDEMELIFGKQAVMNFCLCNVWKYRFRANAKNGEEDLRKSDWYMKKYMELSNGTKNI